LTTVGGGSQQIVNSGTIYVKLTDIGERSKSQEEMMVTRASFCKIIRRNCGRAFSRSQAFSGGGFRNANVQFLIAGPDLKNSKNIRKNSWKK
jgi:hydrophobic/amphiphilic exporter-1 (mainly G- bacteria), HAE1 family